MLRVGSKKEHTIYGMCWLGAFTDQVVCQDEIRDYKYSIYLNFISAHGRMRIKESELIFCRKRQHNLSKLSFIVTAKACRSVLLNPVILCFN